MVILIIVCVIIIAILFFLYRSLCKDVKSLHKQLAYTREEKSTFSLYTSSNTTQIKDLVNEINALRNVYQIQQDRYVEMDNTFKRMITNISHDIRTPLTSIKGYLQMLKTSDEQDSMRYYTIVEERISYLQNLLENLFLYTKISNDDVVYHSEVVCLYDALCENILPFYQQFQMANIQIEIEAREQRTQILADPVWLQRIFANMFSNILKYAVDEASVCLVVEGSWLLVQFRNEVCEDMDVNAMFERFYTGDHARSQATTGLGLAIVKELVEKLQGRVKGELLDKHICITLSFPIYQETQS